MHLHMYPKKETILQYDLARAIAPSTHQYLSYRIRLTLASPPQIQRQKKLVASHLDLQLNVEYSQNLCRHERVVKV